MRRGQVWFVDFGTPTGSEAGYRRPAIIVQHDAVLAGGIRTLLVVPITSGPSRASQRWTVSLDASRSKLPQDSLAQLHLIAGVDLAKVDGWVATLPADVMDEIDFGLLQVFDLAG